MKVIATSVAFLFGSILAAPSHAGPEWMETGDAGNLPDTAQRPTGGTVLSSITGRLDGDIARGESPVSDFQDMYEILITDVDEFSAFVSGDTSGGAFDTQLWLFDSDGRGVLGNQDSASARGSVGLGGSGFGNMATDQTKARIPGPGRYFIAISGAGSAPLDQTGALIFEFTFAGEVSGPDGSSGSIGGWTGPGAIGGYALSLTGAAFVPAPGAGALFMIAGAACSRRRR